jgi:hypothetical protein
VRDGCGPMLHPPMYSGTRPPSSNLVMRAGPRASQSRRATAKPSSIGAWRAVANSGGRKRPPPVVFHPTQPGRSMHGDGSKY